MTKEELIANQQLKIESYKVIEKENKILFKKLIGHFVSIGQPLNDNFLQFNKSQLKWVYEVYNLINEIQ